MYQCVLSCKKKSKNPTNKKLNAMVLIVKFWKKAREISQFCVVVLSHLYCSQVLETLLDGFPVKFCGNGMCLMSRTLVVKVTASETMGGLKCAGVNCTSSPPSPPGLMRWDGSLKSGKICFAFLLSGYSSRNQCSLFQWTVFSGSKATYSCGPYGYFRSTNGEIYYR